MPASYWESLGRMRGDVIVRAAKDAAKAHPKVLAGSATMIAGAFMLNHILKDPNNFPGDGYGITPVYRFVRALKSGGIIPYLDALRDRYGPVVSVRGPRMDFVFIFDPDLVIKFFSMDEEMLRAANVGDAFRSIFGMESIMGRDRQRWKRVRSGFSVLTSSKHLKYAVDVAIDKMAAGLDEWNQNRGATFEVEDLGHELRLLGQNTTALQTMGYAWDLTEQENAELSDALDEATDLLSRRLLLPPTLMPVLAPMSAKAAKGIALIREKIGVAVASRLEAQAKDSASRKETDLITALVSSGEVDAKEIEDAAMGGFTSARANVAKTLLRCLVRLHAYPSVLTRARAEIRQHLGDGRRPLKTYEDMTKVEYIDAIVREELRYEPHTTFLAREVAHDIEVGGRAFKKGTNLMLVIPSVHWNEDFYERAREYRPERWMGDRKWFRPNMYMPLGHGPRACPGERLARMTIRAQLILLINEYDWEVVDGPEGDRETPKKHFRFTSRW